jgi:hypothetical protein
MIEQASLVLGNGNWAVKSDSLLGYKTIDGKYYPREFTFTRATTGTRVNEAGLVEVVPYNLLSYSEEFDNAVWSKTSVTVTVNATTSPSGVLTADKLIPSGLDSYVRYMSFNGTAGSVYTFSFYAKADVITNIRIRQFNATELNGTVEYITINNQWQRFTVTSTCAVNQQVQLWIGGSSTWSTGEDIYVWGAQLVEGTEPLDYLPTTDRLDIARIDYSTGEPALLLEPQRTNVWVNSDDFNAGTISSSLITYTANTTETTAPNGTNTADKFEVTTSGGDARRRFTRTIAIQNFSLSLYVKGAAGQKFQLFLARDSFAELKDINTTLNGEWQRIVLNDSFSTTSSTVVMGVEFGFTSDDSVAGQIYYLWGAQLEAGSYPTSYIPTTSASVTRSRDQCVKTGISSLINSTEGVLYAEIAALSNDLTNRLLSLSDGTSTNRIFLGFNSLSNSIRFRVQVNNVYQAEDNFIVADTTQYLKIGFKFKENDFALWINGVEVLVDNSGSTFSSNTLNTLSFDSGAGGSDFFGKCKNLMVFPTALSDDELATLTTI